MITSASELERRLEALRQDRQPNDATVVLDEDSESLLETLCALANLPQGGSIIFGLDATRDFEPCGISNIQSLEDTILRLTQHLRPVVEVQFYRASINEHQLVIVNVHSVPIEHRPCRVATTQRAYVRDSHGNRVVSDHESYRMQTALTRSSHDQAAVEGTNLDHLHSVRTALFLEAARRDSASLREASDEQVLRMKGVLEPVGNRLTLAGLYVLGRYPQQFHPNLTLMAVLETSDATQRQRFDGPLPELIEQAVRWVLRTTRRSLRDRLGSRGSHGSRLPITAIREVITNALIHRDLSHFTLDQPVEVVLNDELLTVTSPGGLWGIHTQHLGTGSTSRPVNATLYEVSRLTTVDGGHRVVDPHGRGLRQVHQVLRRAGMHTPTYRDSGLDFTVTLGHSIQLSDTDQRWLRSLPTYDSLTTGQRYLLAALSHQPLTTAKIRDDFGPQGTKVVLGQLAGLVDHQLVEAPDAALPAYRLHADWRRAASTSSFITDFRPRTVSTSEDADADEDSPEIPAAEADAEPYAQRAAASSKHGAKLWNALAEGPQDIHALAQAADLSLSQTRYAMQRLVAEGLVHRSGGQGHRQTVYRQIQHSAVV